MKKECFYKFPELETERLNLRAFTELDFNDYVSWNCGEVLYNMMGLHYIKEDDIAGYRRLFLVNVPKMFKTKESIIWCIAEKASNKTIGKIEMCKFDNNTNMAQIHYCLSNNERSKGYMTEVVKEVIKWAFEILELSRIYTYVWEENKASVNVLMKCGFKLEGTLREHSANKYTLDGHLIKDTKKEKAFIEQKEYKNECIYGLLKSEYYHRK